MTQQNHTQDIKITVSDPTALGLFGLAMVTLVASSQKLGLTSGTSFVIPWALFLGSAAQIWAACADFKRNNYFGSIAFATYGLFWVAVGIYWATQNGWFGDIAINGDAKQFGVACLGYFIFSFFIMIASFEVNKVLAVLLFLICVLFASLTLSGLGVNKTLFSMVAAWSELLISLLGFYGAGATFLNNFFGRTVLPMGAPLGWIKKAA